MITHIKKLITLVLVCMLSLSVVSCDGGECDHDYGKWTVKKEATCTEKGKKVRECKECGEQDKKSIAKKAHSVSGGVCTVCGKTLDEIGDEKVEYPTGGIIDMPTELPTEDYPTEIPTDDYPTEYPTEDPTETPEEIEISEGYQGGYYIEGQTSLYFRFVPSESGEYMIRSTNTGDLDPSVALWDYDKNYITENDDGGDNWNFSLTHYLMAGETYYFSVYTPSSGTVYFELMQVGLSTAVEITEDSEVSVYVPYSGAAKYYYFTANYSGAYVISTYSYYDGIGIYAQVLDQYGNSVSAARAMNNGYASGSESWFYLEEGQQYYIKTGCDYERSEVSYYIELDEFSNALSYNTVDYVDDWRYVQADNGDDRTYYAFTPLADITCIIKSAPYNDGDYYYADARLYDCYGNLIATDDHMGENGGIHIVYEMQGGQTYFLEATSDYGYSAEYNICFSYDKVYHELTRGYSKEVNVDNYMYKEYFTFTPEVSGMYHFYSTSYGFLDTYATLYDADGNSIIADDSSGADGNFYISCYLEAGVEYCFEAGMYSDNLGIFEVHFESKYHGATEMVLGENYYVSIDNAGDYAYFFYVPSTSGYYRFYSTGGDGYDTYGELYSEDGSQLTTNDDGASEYRQFCIEYYLEAGQTYYLWAKLYDSSITGTFYVYVTADY